MTATRTLDVSHLPPIDVSNRAPLFWGQVLACVIEGVLLCLLIAAYFYMRLNVDVWPPPGVKLPDRLIPSLALIPLLASTIGSYRASEAAKKDDRQGMLASLGFNFLFGVVFLGFRAVAWRQLDFTWSSDVYGSVVWSILFLHSYDMVADLLMTAVLIIIIASGRYGQRQRLGVHVDSVIWYFLAGIWLPLYAVVYWAPYLVGTR